MRRDCSADEFEFVSVEGVKEYVSFLISRNRNSLDRLLALARYSSMTKRNDLYIYFASITGSHVSRT